jgi:predicted metal-dependent HD superfamily phosphohydrolase
MNMKYDQLRDQVKQEVARFFKSKQDPNLTYHNLAHTESVVARATELAQHYQLGERDLFIVMTAAWFHDSGYFNGGATDHELRGADMAEFFLKEKQVDEETILAVRNCIMATRIPQNPHSLLEQIVCDADLFHFGTDMFAGQSKMMRKEVEWRLGKKIDKAHWRQNTIALLEAHHYQTGYARKQLDEGKAKNLKRLKEKETEKTINPHENGKPVINKNITRAEPHSPPAIGHSPNPAPAADPNKKQKKPDRPERGIDTMFRISSGNNQRLSDMADNKAHIMITTTSIIISVLLSVLLRKLEDNPHLVVPTLLLLFICVTTMVFSILATRPTLPKGSFTQEDLNAKKVNLLFFGNYYRMNYEEYESGIQKIMSERELLYGSLTRDVYSQGVVLGRKYRLLRIGYNVFMYGVVASVIAFVIASVFFK